MTGRGYHNKECCSCTSSIMIRQERGSSTTSSASCRTEVKASSGEKHNANHSFPPGTPINRLPVMAKQVLDLYELYNLVVEKGGLVEVINKKLWQEIIKGLNLPSSITSAAFTLRSQYTRYLVCKKDKGLSFLDMIL